MHKLVSMISSPAYFSSLFRVLPSDGFKPQAHRVWRSTTRARAFHQTAPLFAVYRCYCTVRTRLSRCPRKQTDLWPNHNYIPNKKPGNLALSSTVLDPLDPSAGVVHPRPRGGGGDGTRSRLYQCGHSKGNIIILRFFMFQHRRLNFSPSSMIPISIISVILPAFIRVRANKHTTKSSCSITTCVIESVYGVLPCACMWIGRQISDISARAFNGQQYLRFVQRQKSHFTHQGAI